MVKEEDGVRSVVRLYINVYCLQKRSYVAVVMYISDLHVQIRMQNIPIHYGE